MIDIIGILYADEVGGEEPAALSGWHVNVTPEVMAARPEFEPYRVEPSLFRRVWAGDDPAAPAITVALRFADEAEGRTFFPEPEPDGE